MFCDLIDYHWILHQLPSFRWQHIQDANSLIIRPILPSLNGLQDLLDVTLVCELELLQP